MTTNVSVPYSKEHGCDDLYSGDGFSTTAACAVIEVHVIIAVHVQQDLNVLQQAKKEQG